MFADDLNRIAGLYEMGPDGKSGRERQRNRKGIGKVSMQERAERNPIIGRIRAGHDIGTDGRPLRGRASQQ